MADTPEMLALVAEVQSGSSEAFAKLALLLDGVLRGTSRSFYAPGIEQADLLQEALLGLLKAARTYNGSSSFGHFAQICIRRRVMTEVTRLRRGRHLIHSNADSLDEEILVPGSDNERLSLYDHLADQASPDPESVLAVAELLKEIISALKRELSPHERKCLVLYLDGEPYTEIAAKAGVSSKSVDNALQKARLKLRSKVRDAS
jgi:RNA polymerase sporulation-specific sigma factor